MLRDNKQAAAKEKHLKSIYELLNRGCNKKAVQDIDKFPKNLRELTVFKALKSLALIRMCKRWQAFDILKEINPDDDDLDEVTLQTMTSCYKESVDVVKIVELYESASRRNPNDQEIMARLFMAYVRVFNFKRQKEIALLMYKNFPKKKRLYFFWAIVSLVMQAQEAKDPDDTDKKVCLTLAERMCDKMIEDERTQEEIELYLTILRKQNKHEEEYRFLTGPLCSRLTDHLSWFNRRRAYLCLDLKMYSRAFKHYFVTLIQEYPDQIEYYQGLFKSALLLDTKAPSQQQSPVAPGDQQAQSSSANTTSIPNQPAGTPVKSSSALAECYDIVEKQCLLTVESPDTSKEQQKGKGSTKNLSRSSSLNPSRKRLLRGPFIAKAELFYTIVSNENVIPKNVYTMCMNQFASKFPTIVSLLLDYFQSFSKKIICFYDLVYMINEYKLTSEDKQSLVAAVHDWIQSISQNNSDMSPNDLSNVILNGHMLKHMLREYKVTDSKEERMKLANEYINLYNEYKNLGNFKTEYLAFDNYCLLAINAIMTNSVDLNDFASQSILSDSLLISLIALSEDTISYSNHHLKLTLLKLYSFIGCSKQSSEELLSLDIKHFQIDTLGHLLNPVLYNTGNYSLSRETLETCLDFYALGIRECFEGLTTSYRDGRFSKVEEISNVFKRLTDSLNATQCFFLKGLVDNLSAETLDELYGACRSFDPHKGLFRIFRESKGLFALRDNRDFKVLKSLNIETDKLVQKRQAENLEDEQKWLTLRYCILRSVFLQLDHHNPTSTTAIDGASQEKYIEELKCAKEVIENLRPALDEAVSNVTDTRYSYFEPESSPFRWKQINFQSLISLVEDIAFLPDVTMLTTEIQDTYIMHLDSVMNDIEVQLLNVKSLIEMKQALLSLTLTLEFISLVITSLVAINQQNNSSGQSSKKSSSGLNQQLTRTKSIPNRIITKTEAQLAKISQLVKILNSAKTLILDKVTEPEFSVKMDTFDKVKEKLKDNYNEVLEEIETICRRKTKLLRCLTLS